MNAQWLTYNVAIDIQFDKLSEAHAQLLVEMILLCWRDVTQESLGDGIRSLVDCSGYATLQLHLQQFGVLSIGGHLLQPFDFIPHVLYGHLHWSQYNLHRGGTQIITNLHVYIYNNALWSRQFYGTDNCSQLLGMVVIFERINI